MSGCPKCGSMNITDLIIDGPVRFDGSSNDHLGSNLSCDDCGYDIPKNKFQERQTATIVDLDQWRHRMKSSDNNQS